MADINLTFGADGLKKLVAEIQKAADNLNAALKKTGIVTEADVDKAKNLAKAARLLKAEKSKLNSVDREQIKMAKRLDTANAKLALSTSKEARQLAVLNEQKRRAKKANDAYAKSQLGVEKSSGRLWKSIAKGNIAASAFTRILRGMGRALKNTIKSIVDFDQAVADVGAIAKATNEEMERLGRSALKLGGSTKFTATEVAGLQKELAKLGFTTSEILNAQAAILDLAAAANTDLANAAEVAGITVNQFGLIAEDTQRVVDIMANSFTKSALDITKFTESMKFVGPAAKASGISLEEATAYLALLADAGISGSMAGTSLRQIMLALSKESGTFTEKIKKAAGAQLDLAGAAEEVQKRAATAFLVITDGIGEIEALTKALEDSAGAAAELAARQIDTLKGQVTILNSAWNRLIITVSKSEKGFKIIKNVLGGFSNLMNNYVNSLIAADEATDKTAATFKKSFLEDIKDNDYASSVGALATEINFISGEIKNYSHDISEANYQLATTKKREKEAIAMWEQKKGTAEGMLRIYEAYLVLLRDINIEEEFSGKDGTERELGVLGKLKETLKTLTKEREFASESELEALNKEIKKVQDKIEMYLGLGVTIDNNKKSIDALTKEYDEWIDEMIKSASVTKTGIVTLEELADAIAKVSNATSKSTPDGPEIDLTSKSFKQLDALKERTEELYAKGIISFQTYQKTMTRIAEAEAEKRDDIVNTSFDIARQAATTFSNLFAAQKEKELSAVGDNAVKRLAIEKEYAKKEQQLAIISAVINTAQGIVKVLGDYGLPWGLIPAAAMAALGGAQIATIKNQQFAEGGDVIGAAHSGGGVNIEAEGGEYVVNKRSTGKYRDLVEAINQDDQMRIMDAMNRDKKIVASGSDPYTRKMYELMKTQVQYGEDNEYFYKHKGNMLIKTKKP